MAAEPGQGSAPGSEGGQQQEAGGAEAPAGPDFSPVLDRINELGENLYDGLEERFGEFESRFGGGGQQQEQQQQEAGGAPGPELVPDGLYNADGEMDPAAAQQLLANMVQQQATPLVQQQIQQAVGPLMEQLTDMRIESDAGRLEEQYPELREQDKAQALFDAATEYAERIGVDPRTAINGAFLELVHNAQRAQDTAAGREPAGQGREPELEAGGAASLAGSGEDTAKAIVGARKRNSFFGT